MRIFPAFVALFLAACGTPTVLEAKDYKVSCTKNSECISVYLGDVCNPCLCDNAAISAEQSQIYSADRTGAQRSCGPITAIGCAQCAPKTPVCTDGTCAVQ